RSRQSRPPLRPCPLTTHPPPAPSFFLPHPPTPDLSPLSLHDALPISTPMTDAPPRRSSTRYGRSLLIVCRIRQRQLVAGYHAVRSEEHTSELQSRENLVCRLLLEKKKKKIRIHEQTRTRKKQSQNPRH